MKEVRAEKHMVVFTTDEMRRTGSYVVDWVFDDYRDANEYMWRLYNKLSEEEIMYGFEYSTITLWVGENDCGSDKIVSTRRSA